MKVENGFIKLYLDISPLSLMRCILFLKSGYKGKEAEKEKCEQGD